MKYVAETPAPVMYLLAGLMQSSRWAPYYEGFAMPYYFYGPEIYGEWLSASGFRPVRVELILKDMQHQGAEGLLGWLRTTWFPYTDRLPVELRNVFLSEVVAAYTEAHPVDAQGNTHVSMVRMEVEACAL